MADHLTAKILKKHLLSGRLIPGEEIAIQIDQTLTQDATGTIAYLQFEQMGAPRVRSELSVSYVDHNTLQHSFENADDHRYLQSVAAHYGIFFSRPGNGICHQVHLERFGIPGKTLLGSDSHTPTGGGLGMLAIGAGGLDVAVAMAGSPFYLNVPEVLRVNLVGEFSPWIGAKDIILELLRRLTVRGGVGRIIEYSGPGVARLTVPQRATIANMGAELGATTSIFPSDEQTRRFLVSQGREGFWKELLPDPGAVYDHEITLELGKLEPLTACPHSPDAVKTIREVGPLRVDQVAIGSCTNSSFQDLLLTAKILEGRTVHPQVSLVISPGSRQVMLMLAQCGALETLIAAGARILEPACGPCIGMGQAPPSGSLSIRTFNRNFRGRCGTTDAQVYLTGPAAAAVSALYGRLTDPRKWGNFPALPAVPVIIDDRMIIPPPEKSGKTEIVRGPNIRPLPLNSPLPDKLALKVLLKAGDHITTDQIMPAGAKILPLRSNIPAISEFVFAPLDQNFARRARESGGGLIVGGLNYGQGSSREHAALAPMYLGIKAVLAKSFARIHHTNLVNFGIIPLLFRSATDYERLNQDDLLVAEKLREQLDRSSISLTNQTQGYRFTVTHQLSSRQIRVILAGGLLNLIRKGGPAVMENPATR